MKRNENRQIKWQRRMEREGQLAKDDSTAGQRDSKPKPHDEESVILF